MLDKRTKKQIEWAFRNYDANKALGDEQEREIAESGITIDFGRIGGSSGSGNPTESKALRLLDKAKQYLWAKVVENTLTAFRFEAVYDILTERYFQNKSHHELLSKYFGCERGYYYALDRALEYAYMWVLEYGLL